MCKQATPRPHPVRYPLTHHPRPSPAPPAAVYNANDYCDIMEHLIERWDIEHRQGLRGDAAEAQVRAAAAVGRAGSACLLGLPACEPLPSALPSAAKLCTMFVSWRQGSGTLLS